MSEPQPEVAPGVEATQEAKPEAKSEVELKEGEGENKGEGAASNDAPERKGCCGCSAPVQEKLGSNIILERSRWCTDIHMLLLFFVFWGGMGVVMSFAWEKGDQNKITFGYDWKGDTCNTGKMEGHDRQYWPNPMYYDKMGAVCLKDIPGSDDKCPKNLPPKLFGNADYSKPMGLICVCNPLLWKGEDVTDPNTKIGALCNTNSMGTTYGYVTVDIDIDPANAIKLGGQHLKDWMQYLPNQETLMPLPIDKTPPACYMSELDIDCGKTRVPLCAPAYKSINTLNRCVPFLSATELENILMPPECNGNDSNDLNANGGVLPQNVTSWSVNTTIILEGMDSEQFTLSAVTRSFRGAASGALFVGPNYITINSPKPTTRRAGLTVDFVAFTSGPVSQATLDQFASYLVDTSAMGFVASWRRIATLVYTTLQLPATMNISISSAPTSSEGLNGTATTAAPTATPTATPTSARRAGATAVGSPDSQGKGKSIHYPALGGIEAVVEAIRNAEASAKEGKRHQMVWQEAWMDIKRDELAASPAWSHPRSDPRRAEEETANLANCPSDEFQDMMGTSKQLAQDTFADLEIAFPVLMGMMGVALIVGFAYLYFMRFFAIPVVWLTLIAIWVFLGMMVGALYINYQNVTEVVEYIPQLATYDNDVFNQKISMGFLVIAGILWGCHTCMIVCLRERVAVACRILSLAAECLTDMPYLVFYPLGQAVFIILFFALFASVSVLLASAGTLEDHYQYGVHVMAWDDDLRNVFAYWLFGFFWTTAFIEATGFMVLAFCVCMWFFAPRPEGADTDSDERELPSGVLCKALKMTLCHHLGTVATGSLIIAIIRMARIVLEYIDSKQKELGLDGKPAWKYVMCVLRCCLWCLEKCARWMNKKVYIETCIHGTWFCSSLCQVAKALFSMISYITIAEFISTLMLIFGKVSIALGTAAIGGYAFSQMNLTSIIFPTLLTLIMGFVVSSMFIEVYGMCVDTMLMCFCEAKLDPTSGVCIPKKLESYMGEQYQAEQSAVAAAGENAANAESIAGLPEVLVAEMKDKFERYDLDKSGTINTEDELQQLMTNLYFSLSAKGVEQIKPDEIATRVKAAGDMAKNNWTFEQWVAWCQASFPEICAWKPQ